ncbi:MAG TPA: 50S ribosomal protein L25 [Acidimicrobiales bacterium]|nr:50S ribosomal protein L25 [Acidimicrobiales bacterium]
MAEVTLVAETGRSTGSAESRRLRATGRIPAVVYGHGAEARSVSVDARDLRHALSGDAGLNQLLSLHIGSETHLALARALQRHPVRHTVLHVDFQIVRRDEVISAEVPLVLIGEAKAVEQERGIVEQLLNFLTVKATPDKIPGHIEIDISGLTVGDGIRVGDLKLPAGATTEVGAEEVIAQGSVTRAAVEEEAAEAEEAAEGEAPAEEEGAAGRAGEAAPAEAPQSEEG